MVIGLEQSKVVPMLRKYLEYNDINLEPSAQGICNGLAAVYVKYALSGKEEEFLSKLHQIHEKGQAIERITSMDFHQDRKEPLPTPEQDSRLNQFIAEVMFAFLPQKFDKQYSQDDSVRLLKIIVQDPDNPLLQTGKPMTQEFNLGLAASTRDWGQILNRLKVDGTAITVNSPTHSIAIAVENGQFRVYDPSHHTIDVCETGNDLAKLLSREVFPDQGKTAKELALSINVYCHPEHQANHPFPSKEWIVQHLSTDRETDKINRCATINAIQFDSLAMAAMQNDVDLIRLLVKNGANHPEVALQVAARDNRISVLSLLLEDEFKQLINNKEKTFSEACSVALESGRVASFAALMEDPEVKRHFIECIKDPEHRIEIFKKTAASECSGSLQQLVECLEMNCSEIDIPSLIKESHAIQLANNTGDKKSMELLAKKCGIELPVSASKTSRDFPTTVPETHSLIRKMLSFTHFIKELYKAIKNLLIGSNPSIIEQQISCKKVMQDRRAPIEEDRTENTVEPPGTHSR